MFIFPNNRPSTLDFSQNSAFLTSPHLAQFASPNVAQFSPNLAISKGGLSAV
ncbi:hypothetical protein BY996DRAFT_7203388 [Phakopsora pachyrhizi]|nr:hypothetical protein BY996DRAFT_7203388 [Phakopsora pachyrhizi]